MKTVRDFLFEGENVFDMPQGWWEKWKKLHADEYDIDKDDFQDTVAVKQAGELVFTYDKARNKVFTDKSFEFLVEARGMRYKYVVTTGKSPHRAEKDISIHDTYAEADKALSDARKEHDRARIAERPIR